MSFTLKGIVTSVKLLHPLKQLDLIVVIAFGITIFVKPEQFINASFPIVVILSERIMFFNPVQPQKAKLTILVTLRGITILVILGQSEKADSPIVINPSERLTVDRLGQSEKAALSTIVILLGRFMLDKPLSLKHLYPIVLTPSGIVMFVKLRQ